MSRRARLQGGQGRLSFVGVLTEDSSEEYRQPRDVLLVGVAKGTRLTQVCGQVLLFYHLRSRFSMGILPCDSRLKTIESQAFRSQKQIESM